MAKKYEIITQLYERTVEELANADAWQSFLATACRNYKLSFDEQVLLFAQKPDATAVLPIEGEHGWNRRFGRWVNRGAAGIAMFDKEHTGRSRLKYYFDISDTHESRFAVPVPIWQMQQEFEPEVIEALGNTFGDLEDTSTLAAALLSAAKNAAEDQITDYLSALSDYKAGSYLEPLDGENLKALFQPVLQSSISYMLLSRCGLEPAQHIPAEEFGYVQGFNTPNTMNALGVATSDISQSCLTEIARTVLALIRAAEQNRTFAIPAENEYPIDRTETPKERSIEHERDHLQTGGRLPAAQPASPSGAGDDPWEVRIDAQELPAEEPQSDVHEPADQRPAEQPPAGGGAVRTDHAGTADRADGQGAGRDGGAEGQGSAGVGPADEQHPTERRGDDPDGTGLQLSGRNGDLKWEVEFFHQDDEQNELLRTCERLKDHRVEIAAFFASHPDDKERGNFLKGFFNNTFIEQILSNGQRVGYRAYDDMLHLWRSSYLSREREVYYRWSSVASRIDGMLMMNAWLSPDERPLPTVEQQQEMILEAHAKDGTGFVLPQAAIDFVITGGNHYRDGKLRIYEFFQQGKTSKENIDFLKDAYGWGGSTSVIPGSGLWEQHDGKGIEISRYSSDENHRAEILMKWPLIEKRIRELIAADRYLSPREKAEYPNYVRNKAIREERYKIVEDFRSIVYDHNDFWTQLGDKDKCFALYPFAECWSAFGRGEKSIRTSDGEVFVLPAMRNVMEQVIAANVHHAERAKAMLETLSGELVRPMEPTYDELNPPPPVPKEYRLSLGNTVYIGAQPYELLALGDEEVTLFDPAFPLFHKTFPRQEFFDLLKENPLNDQYLHAVEPEADAVIPEAPSGDVPFDTETANRLEAERLIREFIQQEYGQDFTMEPDGTLTPIATALTENELHTITVYADLSNAAVITKIDGVTVKTEQYSGLEELLETRLRHLELKELTAVDMAAVPMVGRIDYLATSGKVAYSAEYISEADFIKEITECLDNGVPITITFYRDGNGKAISPDFVFEQGSMPKGMDVTDNPYLPKTGITAHPLFAKATELIDAYCEAEFDSAGDYFDLRNIPVGHTTITDDEIPVQINVNLMDFSLDRYVDGVIVDRRSYDSLEKLIEKELEALSFEDLISFTDEQLRKVAIHGTVVEHLEDEAPATFLDHFYVAEDIQKHGALDIAEYPTLEEALVAYRELPSTQMKALGAMNTRKPLPGSLDFLHCKDGVDTIVEDYQKVDGWENPEVLDVIQRIKTALAPLPQLASPPAPRPKARTATSVLLPEIPTSQRHNFRITNNDLGVGTPSQRYANNVAAIRLLKRLEVESRLATPEEQGVLSRYVGWGGLAACFEEKHSKYQELKSLLTEEEYAAARESSLTAFYTPPVVIRAMYQALENMNFRNGNILEPSCGVGNFLGMLPESMKDSQLYGVELDSISGRIAQQLYQKSSIAVQGFEKTELPDSFFDAAVGNVPFGQFKVPDKQYDKHNFLIHDYFFARTLDKVRPGGIVAFITSKGTMDKENPAVRKYIAQRADLLGAIRLPNDTFKGAAGTEVTSDIIFLQKRDRMVDIEPDWVHLDTDENGLKMNQYFIDNPDMVLGEMKEVSGPYGPELACVPCEGQPLEDLLSNAIQNIHAEITAYEIDELSPEDEDKSIPALPTVRNFSYTVVEGTIYYRENSRMTPVEVSATAASRIKGLIAIRDCVRQLIEYQTEDFPESFITAEQKKLNELYDAFSQKYGLINSRANTSAFNADSSYCLLASLEILDDEGNFVRKADMFSKRTIRQKVVVTSVDTASEALALSLAERARVDMDYMTRLTGKTEEQIYADLQSVIFLNPDYAGEHDSRAKYLTADEYLSGNVRAKLAQAQQLAEHQSDVFNIHVQALQTVQPKDLSASEISVRLGATWLPPDVVENFMYELFGTPHYARWRIKVRYSKVSGEWSISDKNYDRSNVKAMNTYGTTRINGYKIIEETLNLKDVRIFDYIFDESGKKTPVLNKKETAIAQGKQEMIKQAFQDWIWKDPNRRDRLCRLYNEKFNSLRPREYDGSHLKFVGMNPEITLRPHQVNAIAHILYGGNTLLAHVVGAGKTFEMVAAAMESKRLGLCQKSLFVVPNHLTEQWASEFLQLYPSANILVATKKDFEAKNRKRFCGRIATGDYDAIIIGHSQFEKIPMSVERQRKILQKQIDDIMTGIAQAKQDRAENFTIKQMERSRKQIQAKLEKLNDQSRKDDLVTFEELGVDRIFVDEAHYYKNLAAYSKMRNVGGISQTEAQKSSDLYMKCRYLDEITGSRGIIFATGTPISNSMVEMYTLQRYLQYNLLESQGLLHFDAWASTFGETVTAIELAPEGSGYRAKTRFARFYNLPELMSMFKEVADIQTADMLKLPVPKANFHSVVLKPSEQQKEMVASLSERAERVRNKMVNATEDNMLLITNDGRKLALDQRLMSPMLGDSETSKANACANAVYQIWQETTDTAATQLVFCDLSTPTKVIDMQMQDGIAVMSDFQNIYDDIRKKLIGKGIPEEQIAFIHSANTEAQKKELFGKVRSGQIRVLLGSTQKMGAGTNVQLRLRALHHLDCPWRPSDLQQREGRIIRQGNMHDEVDIYTYVTENTFDSYLYQLVESKQKFIGQIMTSKSPVRSAEDIDETALSYAEIKALCTGNPYIKEKMDLDIDVQRLRLLKANHLSQRYALEDRIIKEFPKQIRTFEQMIAGLEADIAQVKAHAHPNEDGFSPMVIENVCHSSKKAAGSAILEVCHNMTSPDPIPLGRYRGFDMKLHFDSMKREFIITLQGELSYPVALGTDVFGNIQRLDNAIDTFPERLQICRSQLENVHQQLEAAKAEVQVPFPKEEELKTKSARLEELNILLNLDKKENEIVDGEISEEEAPTPKTPSRDR